jgi:hypothetical protein
MRTILDPTTDAGLRFRFKQLHPTSTARWGKTTAPRVVAHMTASFEDPLREPPPPPRHALLAKPSLRWLYLHCVPCPNRRSLVAPEVLPEEIAGWQANVDAWYEACARFQARGRSPAGAFAPHPLFGPLPTEEWGRLVFFHTDHHLRQFGL